MAKAKGKKRTGQGAGAQENKNKQRLTCTPCNVSFKSCSKTPLCPKCRKPVQKVAEKPALEF